VSALVTPVPLSAHHNVLQTAFIHNRMRASKHETAARYGLDVCVPHEISALRMEPNNPTFLPTCVTHGSNKQTTGSFAPLLRMHWDETENDKLCLNSLGSSRHGPLAFDNTVLSEVEFYRFRPGDALPYASYERLIGHSSVIKETTLSLT